MKIQQTQFVQLPLLGIVDNLEITVNSFSLFPTTIEVLWKISGPTVTKEGSIKLPNGIVTSWGTDDTIIKDYVLQQLGLIEDLTPEPSITETPVTQDPTIGETPIDENPI